MPLFDDAKTELQRLEAHWISLLTWFAEKTGRTPDDLVQQWSTRDHLEATAKMAAAGRAPRGGPQWTLLHFLDFGRYSELAGSFAAEISGLGNPPRNWRGRLGEQANAGIVRFRNHLQHANRFLALPRAQQEQALALFKQQRAFLAEWWPDCHVTSRPPPPESPLRAALRALGPDPDDALPLVEELGMRPISNARNLIDQAGAPSQLSQQLEADLEGLYEVGDATLGGARAGIYLCAVRDWQLRSASREPVRRRVAKALREREAERLRIFILADSSGRDRDVELVLPRVREGAGVGTVRAAIATEAPTHHHLSLLESLRIGNTTRFADLVNRWNEAFGVEAVTRRFFEEFKDLRDRMIDELRRCNPDIEELQGDRLKDRELDLNLHAFGTRQLGRILFLWFLQQKRWLGGSPGDGKTSLLADLFRDHAGDNAYFSDVIVPLCFDGLGRRLQDQRHKDIEARFGALPFLGGGIFNSSANEFEARVFAIDDDGVPTRRVVLPNDLFDPKADEADGAGKRGKRKRSVLGLLSGYRFTTQESTPDDQSFDPDPELLGKVLENLYQSDERHRMGAYYTPREIVQFMCRRTLDGYLRERTGIEQADVDWLREEAVDWTASGRRLDRGLSDAVIHALDSVRVCDPAVGSGAFLLGMMHEIVTLKRGIEQSDRDRDYDAASMEVAEWKRRIATDSLYGVDINPMAVEICQLRLWLSLIVDLEVSNFRDIPTLPNLDFRIIAGDSLVDRMGAERFFESLPMPEEEQINLELHGRVKDLQKEVDTLKLKWWNESDGRRDQKRLRELRGHIRQKQIEIARVQLDYTVRTGEDDLRLLQGPRARAATKRQIADKERQIANARALLKGLHERAPYQKPFLWPVNFHEVFEEGGFDIVLANPPYSRMENIDNVDEATYAYAFAEVAAGRADLLVYFYARAVQILRDGGQLAFITSNKYMRVAYGAPLREWLPQVLFTREVIDFGDLPLFSVDAYPAVLVGAKRDSRQSPGIPLRVAELSVPVRQLVSKNNLSMTPEGVRQAIEDLEALLARCWITPFPQALLRKVGWILEEPRLVELFDRLMSSGEPLIQRVGGRVYRGVITGLDEAFVIDTKQCNALLAANPRCAEVIRPWLKGRHVKRWAAKSPGLYVLFMRRGVRIETYPEVEEHLRPYRQRLERRATSHLHPWYELQQPQEGCYREFENPKLMWPSNCAPWATQFCFDDAGTYFNSKAYAIGVADRNLCGYLNAPITLWLADKLTTRLRGGWIELKSKEVVNRLPVPPELPDLWRIEDRELHQRTSRLLGLNATEESLIWDWYTRRQIYQTTSPDEPNDDDDD